MSTENDYFFKHLSIERKKLTLSMEECASKCGVGRQMWGKYERGETYPSSEVLLNFAKLGADVASLFADVQEIKHVQQAEKPYFFDQNKSNITDTILKAYAIGDESSREALLTIADLILKNQK